MKKGLLTILAIYMIGSLSAQPKVHPGYPYTPVPFTAVKVTDQFWGQRLKASREVSIPLAFRKCEETGRYKNFERAAQPGTQNKVDGFSFDDTDVYKTIEGASYLLQTYPDKKLKKYIDSVLLIVAKAQEPDGYLYTARTMNPGHPHQWAGSERWEKVEELSHEFYNLGHMVDGAVAHYQATGQRNFLNIAMRYADCVYKAIGDQPGQKVLVPGHQIAEMALARLYVITGEKKYLDLAKFFLDKRGYTSRKDAYSQAHKPILQQDEAVGHAVRAAYMYSGIADVAALTGDKDYIQAIDKIWENVVNKKLYITGGIGATSKGEAFGKNYELPNMSAYCETCAAIGNVYWNYRLFLLHGEAKYYDVLERTLYNGLISGVSLDGGGFFYPNPLESMGQHQRSPWFGCACCPSNVCRFIPSVPGYIYAVEDKNIYVNLFVANVSDITVNNKRVVLEQLTEYPWKGDVKIKVTPHGISDFALKIRVPGWVQGNVLPGDLYQYMDDVELGYTLKVNGQAVKGGLNKGYFEIARKWRKGDVVEVHFDMEPRIVKAKYQVEADRGRVAVERGPLVYCAEWPDNDFSIHQVLMNQKPHFEIDRRSDLLFGVDVLKTDAQTLGFDHQGRLVAKDVKLSMIPYYAWAHRGAGEMLVWLPCDLSASSPAKPATIASESKVTASKDTKAVAAVNDRLMPLNPGDRSVSYTHWWPAKHTSEWVIYEFKAEQTISSASVYWFDDEPWGDCRIPKGWKIYYWDKSGEWSPVKNTAPYPIAKNMVCTVKFKPVKTGAVKLEVQLPDDYSSGLFEWEVK